MKNRREENKVLRYALMKGFAPLVCLEPSGLEQKIFNLIN